jgi:hypothetical protein
MCTVVVDIDPRSPAPVLLIGVRDEFLDRPWLGPDRHWPRRPDLVGGQDLRAAGTWLAVHPGVPRAACVLNGHGAAASDSARLTRGELPLRLAADGALGDLDPVRYDPFHLLCATPDATRLWSWNGERLTERELGPGLHVIVNSGLEGADDPDGPGAEEMQARIDHFRPLLAKARRPEPVAGAGSTRTAWGDWFPLAGGSGLDPSDPRALLVRRTFDAQAWGTSSVSLVALARDAARYDFCAAPLDPHPAWSPVLIHR